MTRLGLIFMLSALGLNAQWKPVAIPSEVLQRVDSFEADDYGNVYLYRQANFSATKLDSLGRMQGRLMQTVPFRLQSVQNPLQVAMFSEGLQEVRLYDAHLVEMQKIPLQEFGYIRAAYLQDQQILWLADEAGRRVLQFNHRLNQLVNSFPFPEDLSSVRDFLYFEDRFYFLRSGRLEIYDQNFRLISSLEAEKAQRLRRDNSTVYVLSGNEISYFDQDRLVPLATEKTDGILNKTSSRLYHLKDGILTYKNL